MPLFLEQVIRFVRCDVARQVRTQRPRQRRLPGPVRPGDPDPHLRPLLLDLSARYAQSRMPVTTRCGPKPTSSGTRLVRAQGGIVRLHATRLWHIPYPPATD